MLNYSRLTIVVLAFSLLFSGCAVFQRGHLPLKSEEQIWAEVKKNNGVIHDFWGKGRITLETGYSVIPVSAEITFREPDWLVVRTSGPMSLKLVEFSLKGDRFQIYSPFTYEHVTGCLDSVDINTAFRIPLPGIDIRSIWTRFFNPVPPNSQVVKTARMGGSYVLSYDSGNMVHEIWVKAKKMNVERENIFTRDGALIGYFQFKNYKKKSGTSFPRTIEIGDIEGGVKLTLEIDKFKINEGVSESQMNLMIPPGVDKIQLGGA